MLRIFLLSIPLLIALVLLLLHLLWRSRQKRAARHWRQLASVASGPGPVFDPALIAHLPEPVQRFFLYMIKPGTPLYSAAEIQMEGEFSFGSTVNSAGTTDNNYQPLHARQILRANTGMMWEARIGRGMKSFQGSDGLVAECSWTQFAWRNLIPIALIQGNRDHYRSAAGRMLAEAAFWTPTVLLTLPGVNWEAHDSHLIVATLSHRSLTLSVTFRLNDQDPARQGQPLEVSFLRWSNANADKTYRLQPFGGYLSEFREFGGVMVPTRLEAGNFFGTADYFPFYKVRVQKWHWLDTPAA